MKTNRRERGIWIGITAVLLAVIVLLSISPQVLAQDREASTQRLIGLFYEVLRFVQNNFVDEVDPDVLIEGAMKGMFEALDDPYSTYLSAEEMEDMGDTTTGRFGGVGLLISKVDEGVQVISPIEDTPAYKVGISAGDLIVAIEGESVIEWTIDEVVSVLRGEPGTPVAVTIRRGKNIRFNVEIVRAMIEVPTVKQAMLPDRIGYLRITNFTPLTAEKVEDALRFFESRDYRSLIIDVRSNPGGLLSAVIDVADLFISRGPIVSTRGRDSAQDYVYRASQRETQVDQVLPIVVMINRGSASASEILAGALQDSGRAMILGEKSYGKASVQQIKRIGDAGFKLTMSRYFTPSGKNIDQVGIMPDIDVAEPELTEDEETALTEIINNKVIKTFVEAHPNPSERDIQDLIDDLADKNLAMQERYIRRLLRNELNLTNNDPPIFDLEFDIVLRRAIEELNQRTAE